MVPIGQKYVPSGAFSLRGVLTALILGGWGAAICAGLVCLWEISPIPTLMILTPIIQGVGVAIVLGLVVTKMKIRNPLVAGTIGLACGLLSVGLQHYGHYVHFVYQTRETVRSEIANEPGIPLEARKSVEEELSVRPYQAIDVLVLVPQTGSKGLLGVMKLRRRRASRRSDTATITGGAMWALWGLEAFLVVAGAMIGGLASAASPFCEDCHRWCETRHGEGGELAGGLADPLAEAILADDPARAEP